MTDFPLPRSFAPLPPRIRALADYGRLIPKRDPLQKRRARMLPRRTPGAALKHNPPSETFEWNVTQPKPRRFSREWLRTHHVLQPVRDWFEKLKAWPLCTQTVFAAEWQQTEELARKQAYRPRHARDYAWRTRWAQYDTQAWPSLATTNPAVEWLEDHNWPITTTISMPL